jgi:hypothetical protein
MNFAAMSHRNSRRADIAILYSTKTILATLPTLAAMGNSMQKPVISHPNEVVSWPGNLGLTPPLYRDRRLSAYGGCRKEQHVVIDRQ